MRVRERRVYIFINRRLSHPIQQTFVMLLLRGVLFNDVCCGRRTCSTFALVDGYVRDLGRYMTPQFRLRT